MILRIKDLEVGYGFHPVVRGVSLEIEQEEIVTIIGSNGAGKSTILCSIAGLVRPHKGKIEFMGENIMGLPPYRIVEKGIVLIPEGRHTIDTMSVYENLLQGAFSRKDKVDISQDVARMMEKFPVLRERRRQLAGTLSGGERQLLAIGMALMGRPKLLMMDEPSLGLAPILVNYIFDIIYELHRVGTPILLVEQNAYKALRLANRAYVIKTGEVVYAGKSQELLANEGIVKAYLGKRTEGRKS